MEGRLSLRRPCGGKEFGTRLLKEGRIEIRENGQGPLSGEEYCISEGLVAGKNRI